MISVINKFEIDRNSSSFPPMEISPNEESRVSSDPEPRVSENGDRFDTPFPDSASGSKNSESDELSLSILGFKTGDMVWGRVKSHPWWPGHIFDESFASPSVCRTKHEGNILVAFFGDSSYGWFDPAELIHYTPNFIEKSKQTTARSFLNAVDESVDESSRRAALGLSCMCRNPDNFRPTHVPGYFMVDVPGFECGGLYSAAQIERSREEFDPEEALVYLQGLALEPAIMEHREFGRVQILAQLLAIRRALFEEFDETYAQAFGVQPTRTSQDNLEDEPEKFAPRVAPLSGPLVIAEALGDKKKKKKKKSFFTKPSSLSPPSSKKKKKNNNKYLLKRRDEGPFLPDAYFGQQQQQPKIKTPSLDQTQLKVLDYVLQKREPEVTYDDDRNPKAEFPTYPADAEIPKATPEVTYDDDRNPKAEYPTYPADAEILKTTPEVTYDDRNPKAEYPTYPTDAEILKTTPATEFLAPILVDQKMVADSKEGTDGTHKHKKKEKIKKRPSVDHDDKGEVIKKKKNKKKKLELLGENAALSSKKADSQLESDRTSEPNVPAVSTPELDLESLGPLDLPELLADLSALAMDPFYGVERNTPCIVGHVFLKLRSIVYEKSLVLPAASESDSPEVQPARPPTTPMEAKQKREVAPKVKLGSLFKRFHDPTKAGRKRAPSDRQEEISAKRVKKLNQLKLLSTEKRAATPQGLKDSNAAPSLASGSVRKPEKQESLLPLPPKKLCPTNLIMKFPPRSTLPSVANLKARFARFGPIVVDRCRVLWSTHTCKVQFKYKVDALVAYKYVQENNLFGQIQVVYSVREVELPGSESQSGVSSQFRPGSMAQPRTSYQQGQLKSILKKPGDDPPKENQRVKFRLAEDSKLEFSFPSSQQLSPPPPPLKPTTSQRVPPPSQLRGPLLSQHTEAANLRQQVLHLQYGGSAAERGNMKADTKVDIYHKMLSLMMHCNDIVAGLHSMPGFVPFRPL